MPDRPFRGWYSRGYVPHLDVPGVVQAVTFRLADALPAKVLASWTADGLEDAELRRRVARYLDAGHGSCVLQDGPAPRIVEEVLIDGRGDCYVLLAWVVMPNHVHVVVRLDEGSHLDEIVKRWKGRSARGINAALGRTGRLWQPGFFDRYVRDEAHLHRVVAYVHENPVRAGLAESPEAWPYSSAARRVARQEAR